MVTAMPTIVETSLLFIPAAGEISLMAMRGQVVVLSFSPPSFSAAPLDIVAIAAQLSFSRLTGAHVPVPLDTVLMIWHPHH